MPAAPFTPAFVESFVLECRAQGLTKEAAANLLQLHALTVALDSPSYAAGFDQVLKEAAVRGLTKGAAGNLGKLLGAGVGLAGDTFRGLRRGAGLAGKGVRSAPAVATGVAGVGLGAGIMGANQARNKTPSADAPLAGVFDATQAAAAEKTKLQQASTGVADLNTRVDADGRRKAELQAAVDSNGPGAAAAIAELQRLRGGASGIESKRYAGELAAHGADTEAGLAKTQEQLAKLRAARGSWLTKLRSAIGMPRDIDGEERALVGTSARLGEQSRTTGELRRRLAGGYVSGDPTEIVSPQDLQSRFFPAR